MNAQTATELSVAQKQNANVLAQISALERSEQQQSVSAVSSKRQTDELKSMIRQVDATRERAEKQLQQSAIEMADWKAQVSTLQTERLGMEKKLSDQNQEINKLRETLESLDKERDKLQAQLDSKSEAMAKYVTHRHFTCPDLTSPDPISSCADPTRHHACDVMMIRSIPID